jgi:hypothetical protein
MKQKVNLVRKYPPSEPCSCAICRSYCIRPGWWTVQEAARAFNAGYANRMMLELAPGRSFGVLSPAFHGCEGTFALQEYASQGCSFLNNDRCDLYGTGFQPLECRFCHHDRPGQGPICHADIELDWNSPEGRSLVNRWCKRTGIWEMLEFYGLGKIK